MLNRRPFVLFFVLAAGISLAANVLSGSGISAGFPIQLVSSVHVDAGQDGAFPAVSQLITSNVTTGKFAKICAGTISGDAYAQVLYVRSVPISSVNHDIAVVATMGNNLYAFDALSCSQLWTANLGTTWTNYSNCCSGNEIFYGNPMGILGSPAINAQTLKMFVVNATATGGTTNPEQVLNRIDLTTGNVEASVTISGSVTGTGGTGDSGNCLSGTTLSFRTLDNMQVSGLSLSPDGSKVYINFGGWENGSPCYHGWVFAYGTSGSMSQAGVFCTTPNGNGASPWMSRGGPSIDASGNVYVVTGNGDYDGVANFGECVLKLSPTLSLVGSFVNPNGSSDTGVDADFGAGRFMLIPGTGLGIAAGKDFSVFLLNTVTMSQVQTFKTLASGTPGNSSGSYGSTFMNNVLYLPLSTGPMYAFQFSPSAGTFNSTPIYATSSTFAGHNCQLSGSINPYVAASSILWVTTSASFPSSHNTNGTLRAFDASTGDELWDSDEVGGDSLGYISKFAAPTIANGRVYIVNNQGSMQVYGPS